MVLAVFDINNFQPHTGLENLGQAATNSLIEVKTLQHLVKARLRLGGPSCISSSRLS